MRKSFTLILIAAALGFSRTATPVNQSRTFQILVHNINQVEMCVSNFGKFGQGVSGNEPGLWWPVGSGQNYVYGAGSWFGTLSGADTMVTIGYGPHGGESEYGPGLAGWVTSDPQAIIFMYPSTWSSIDYTRLPMAPRETKSHQDSWCAYNDLDATWHMPGDTKPIGLEVYQTVYAWNLSTTQDIIFIKYETKNVSGAKLTNCYFGVACDNDIGNESGPAANDRISGIVGQWYVIDGESLWVDNLGYQWQETAEAGWSSFPGAIGFDYLQSPYDLVEGEDKDNDGIPDQYEMDSAWYATNLPSTQWDVDGDGTPDWRDPSQIPQIGMTAFKRFTLNLEPNKDNERYVTLAGYNFKTMAYEPFNDTVPPAPDDQRFLQCSGPFELDTNVTATVMVAVILANWYEGTIVRPDTALVKTDNMAQFIYDMNWLLPGPPPPPNLTCVPGDKAVTLVWDNLSEITPDPYYKVVHYADTSSAVYDPFYMEYDFQGYSVYKSKTALAGTWEKLAGFDKYDGIIWTYYTGSDTLKAVDNGLVHSYMDEDVRNGFTYNYAVAAFDWNLVKETDSTARVLMFQSGYVPVVAVPRREPANYIPGSFTIESESGNPALATNNIAVAITYPLKMTADPMYLEFGGYLYDPINTAPFYRSFLVDNGGNYVDTFMTSVVFVDTTLTITEAPYEFKEFHGLSVTSIFKRYDIPTNVSIFDTVIMTGTYPESLVAPKVIGTNWAYRGNDYEVTWIKAHGSDSVNSVTVVDLMTGETIPYKAGSTDTLADGWCFKSSVAATNNTDTLVYDPPGGLPTGTRSLYVCGGEVNLKKGPYLVLGDPRPGDGDLWTVRADPAYLPAPINGRLKITPTPAFVQLDSALTLNVKVVPNPYIIANEWQQSFRLRRLRFINLPSTCTIRVFNLNGELVKTLTHTNNTTSSSGSELSNFTGGDEWWDLLSENRQLVASGIYVFHVQSDVGEQIGKFVVIR
ncbi:MAG TPA: hypothetical protein VF399_03720 [bacterium]